MKATIEEIKDAKKLAESQVSQILGNFAHQYNLHDMDVDITISKFMDEGKGDIIGMTITTEINVKI